MRKRHFEVVGHRGAMGHAPENTLASFHKAIELGAQAIELDIKLSKDKKIVVVHDDNLKRLTGRDKYVGDLTYASLRRLDAGSHFGARFKGEKIPLLEDVLAEFGGKVNFFIEIKNGPVFYKGIESKLVTLLKKRGLMESVTVTSFDHSALLTAKGLAPTLRTGILFVGKPVLPWIDAEIACASFLCPQNSYVTREFVSEAQQRGIGVYAWSCNTEKDIERMLDCRVDAVCSDYPDLVRRVAIRKKVLKCE